ncbi:MAG: 30S ribosomal protein S17 [Candidatus Beckwithbacteria bacterium GW2011_GWB1_47_15]|uniref:30S ribosomal protein S17 n=1 Tax=Candidatus Beckwithbacteria bacterium GW2011_GWB1_47_15 TaxID=1618371 RepID=A0A0G1U6R4_9BACT|nr:MAG: 30S ribosomal protein S17, small subunit ribosomal protein S17 [Candidatus Beckwithbacteria bacterium GW2011_GWC1_49_16]AQS30752.1 hypothetical protein [uncultured bacterium]KKU35939.1 MAG: 30S ribosomal protein S17 [Candidatus Beckwithbacteria bacterium GW2011_GWA1_46_30]KKU61903.1 MAG: 30S ribosomal protein S17 [Candidatus Beckwithbacteria bacterium GW2011_GWB1_47_15]KKU72543.1 MAG: 30S ribosomal protein S17 [Candidatus Beckwithbacteria bacterium GW2011_GWA2_47_25]KKW04290.1 MAG: 30S
MKKQITGTVVHTKMVATAKVLVVRRWSHPLYQKTLTVKKHYLAANDLKLAPGDKVVIEETPPISKKKRWKVIKKL